MTVSSPARSARPTLAGTRSGRWVPWLFVAAFLVVLAANGALIYLAVASFSGLDTENAYAKGLAYDTTLAAAERLAARRWQAGVEVTPQGDAAGRGRRLRLVVSILDRSGAPVTGLELRAVLRRPTSARHDVEAALTRDGAGRFAAVVDLPLPGVWDLRILAGKDGEVWQDSRRIEVP